MPSLDLVRLSFLQWVDSEENEQQGKYGMFRGYYEGQHETQLSTRLRKFLELKSTQEFNCNFCPLVVDALSERLKVVGLQCEDQAETLWEWWQKDRMDATQGVVHTATLRDGDGYVLVEWNEAEGRPHFCHENAYDGTEGVRVIYSPERRTEPMLAMKKWLVTSGSDAGKVRRLNLYYPDRIEKYEERGSAWMPFEEEGRSWPEPWVDMSGQPLGVPVIHFRNKDQGYSYGESELEDVLPLQNALNKALIDIIAAADTTAFRTPWMTGGKPENMSFAPGSWVYTTTPEARIGSLDGGDLSGLIAIKDSLAADIAKITRTPLSYFQLSGQVAAEGTLKQQESGLVGKARDRAVVFGNSWEDAFYLARRLANTFGGGSLDEAAIISALWADPETRNEHEHLEGLRIKAELGVPTETIWAEMGYDAPARERMQEEKQREQAAQTTGLAQALLNQERQFNAG